MQKQKTPDYKSLREVLEKDIGKEYADKFSDEDVEQFGDFLLALTRGCRF